MRKTKKQHDGARKRRGSPCNVTQLKAIKTQASSKVGCLSLNVETTFVIRVILVSKRKVAWPSSLAFTDHPEFNSSLLKLAGFVLGSPKSTK